MTVIEKLHKGVDRLSSKAPLHWVAQRQARQAFLKNRSRNLFLGVHASWDEAVAAARMHGTAGYDNTASAAMYDSRIRMDAHDYPSLYWLTRSLQDGMKGVFDVGGAIGIKFLAFSEPLRPFQDLIWRVCDVPAMVAHGRELATARGDGTRLEFTDQFAQGEGLDILFASGVLQYLPYTLGEALARFRRLPRRIVINTAAIHPEHDFFTVNSIGTAYCPYRVQTQAALVRGLNSLGYRIRDNWINPGKLLTIPCLPEYSLQHYSGFCLDLA